MFSGMDPTVVRSTSAQLSAQTRILEETCRRVDRLIGEAGQHWHGRDIASLVDEWTMSHRPRLRATIDAHARLADLLLRQADEQEATSEAQGGSLSPALLGAGYPPSSSTDAPAPVTADLLLQLSKAAYASDGGQLPPGWRDASPEELRDLGLSEQDLDDLTGLDARVTVNGEGEVVLAFAGSVDGQEDWIESNLGSAINSTGVATRAAQVENAIDVAKKIELAVGSDNLTITGHSLGGREAAAASLATGARAVTFNAAGVTEEDLLYAHLVNGGEMSAAGFLWNKISGGLTLRGEVQDGQITNYVASRDLLSGLQESGIGKSALGETVVVDSSGAGPIASHDLRNFDGRV